MNDKVQLCGLIVIGLLFILMVTQKSLGLQRQRLFRLVLCVSAVCLGMNMASVILLSRAGGIETPLSGILCRGYLVSLVWTGWITYAYMMDAVLPRRTYRLLIGLTAAVSLAGSAASAFLPIQVFHSGGAVYTNGPADLAAHICVILFCLLIVCSSLIWRRKMNSRKYFGMQLWVLLIVAAGLVQFLFRELQLLSFAVAVGDLVLFILMENPEANMDRTLGCFNSHALAEFIDYQMSERLRYPLLRMEFVSEAANGQQRADEADCLRDVIRQMEHLGKKWVFKDTDLALVVFDTDLVSLRKTAREILVGLPDEPGLRSRTCLMLFTELNRIESAEDLRQFFAFVRSSELAPAGEITALGDSALRKYRAMARMKREIREALAEDRIEVFYQPIYSIQEERIVSAEALVRMRGRDGSLILPDAFIPVAEESGQIREIGEVVIEKVCRLLKESDITDNGIRYIEINLSVVQCESTELADRIMQVADSYGIDHRRINLEITETVSINSKKILLENMQALMKNCFSFSLDDFGQGQSNLMYVVDMPISIIKLDMELTKAYFTSDKARQAVRAIVEMAHRMQLQVICEGVETAEEERAFREEKVDFIQGFFYYRPMPVREFLEVCRSIGK